MDFSRLHMYTPPQSAPDNTGYTYSLSSSYSSAALDFENKHRIEPVFDSPRMSRRSLRLTTGHFSDDSFLDTSSHSVSYSGGSKTYRESKTLKSRTASKPSSCLTPRKTQVNSSLLLGHNSFQSSHLDSSLMSTVLDESSIQEKTFMDGWGLDEDGDPKGADATLILANGDINTAQTQTTMVNGYTCNDCSILSERKGVLTTYSSSSSSTAAGHAAAGHAAAGHAPAGHTTASTVYCRDKTKKHKSGVLQLVRDKCCGSLAGAKASVCSLVMLLIQNILVKIGYEAKAHSSYCGSMNVKELMTGDGHLNLNGSLWKAANGAFWWLGTGWYQLVTLMSLLNVFILTRCLPKLYKLLLLLIPLFLFLGWWYWGPSGLLSFLPALMQSEGEAESEIFPTPSSLDHGTAGHTDHPHPSAEGVSGSFDAERVAQLERRLALLWDSHTKSSRQGEERHGEVLGLYHSLQERLAQASNKEALSLWISSLFEERLAHLKEDLQQDRAETEKNQDGYLALHQSHESRLADLERLLQIVASKTEELQHRQDSATPAAVSEGSEDQGLLLSEVKRLELELNRIKADLLGVKSCQGKCDRLDSLQDTVEAQVRDSVKMLIYGSRQAEMPESLLQWLSSQYVQQSDLQAVLLSLERSILRNISRHSGHGKVMPSTQVVTNAVHHAGVTGMSEEQVRVIVHNALKLYSQDRTGLVDYALESGGGSILSTRCSETYETKTALMSLFGVPLWYFSQSPRVVIQPDVYPGNCWAFKGSQGYLVIRLSLTILPTSFSLEHIPKALSPTGNITSAPRDFTVYGLEDEYQEEGKLLGQYTYSEDGESLQTFAVTEQNEKAYQIIEIRVLSNWGHPEYTCLYRFRVHGEPHQP
ncbi:SUN domain-containing protein 1 isoform X8 [Amia ocellicauda]|uniref:SUN domain-containing protein 1 isoform X8 n=1 Tax=Amia ocellicauda TaxID=2972642 RepID=UPI0034639E67